MKYKNLIWPTVWAFPVRTSAFYSIDLLSDEVSILYQKDKMISFIRYPTGKYLYDMFVNIVLIFVQMNDLIIFCQQPKSRKNKGSSSFWNVYVQKKEHII